MSISTPALTIHKFLNVEIVTSMDTNALKRGLLLTGLLLIVDNSGFHESSILCKDMFSNVLARPNILMRTLVKPLVVIPACRNDTQLSRVYKQTLINHKRTNIVGKPIRNLKNSLSGKTKDIVRSLAAFKAIDKVDGSLLRYFVNNQKQTPYCSSSFLTRFFCSY